MQFERRCAEDKASHLASPSKDFYSLINTNSAILAPLEICLRGRPVPWGTLLMVNRVFVLAGSGHGSSLSSVIERPEAILAVLPLGPIFCSLRMRTVSAYMTVALLKIWVMFPGKMLVICTELRRQSQPATNWCSPEERKRAKAINSWLTPVAAAPGAEHLYSYPDTACGKSTVTVCKIIFNAVSTASSSVSACHSQFIFQFPHSCSPWSACGGPRGVLCISRPLLCCYNEYCVLCDQALSQCCFSACIYWTAISSVLRGTIFCP